jgi:hypothetical protein
MGIQGRVGLTPSSNPPLKPFPVIMYRIIRRYLCEFYIFCLRISALLWGQLELFYPFFLQLRFFLYHRYLCQRPNTV